MLVGLILTITLGTESLAEKPDKQGKPRQNDNQGQRQMPRDPDSMALMMLREFDANGDSQLNRVELTNLLVSMRERRGRRGQGRRGAGEGRPGAATERGEIRPRIGAGRQSGKPMEATVEPVTTGGIIPIRPGT